MRKQIKITLTFLLVILFASIIMVSVVDAQNTISGSFAYVTNSGDNTVSIIDTSKNNVTDTVNFGAPYYPSGIAFSPDGTKAYLTNSFNNTISIMDTATTNVTNTINVGYDPKVIAISPDGTKLYVGSWGAPKVILEYGNGSRSAYIGPVSGNISEIDISNNSVIATLPLEGLPNVIAITPDGKKIYVVNSTFFSFDSNITVIDTTTNNVTALVGGLETPYKIVVTPNGKKAYVTQGFSGNVSVINTSTNKVISKVSGLEDPSGIAISPDGTKVYVASSGSGNSNISTIDTATDTVKSTVSAGSKSEELGFIGATEVAVSPDGTKIYAANLFGKNVFVIDTATNKVKAT